MKDDNDIKSDLAQLAEPLEKETHSKGGRKLLWILLLVLCFVLLSSGMKLVFTSHLWLKAAATNEERVFAHVEKAKLEKELLTLERKVKSRTPNGYYLIINSSSNQFSLYKGQTLIKTDKCSTGSYTLLKNGDQQEWMFKTPKGIFKIKGKTTSPVWKKPDWAFVEEGLSIPPANHDSRFEYGVLGDYALSLGQGYLIHGTLYQRFLGLPVTHGCIRLNDQNLELVFNSLSIGSNVYIF